MLLYRSEDSKLHATIRKTDHSRENKGSIPTTLMTATGTIGNERTSVCNVVLRFSISSYDVSVGSLISFASHSQAVFTGSLAFHSYGALVKNSVSVEWERSHRELHHIGIRQIKSELEGHGVEFYPFTEHHVEYDRPFLRDAIEHERNVSLAALRGDEYMDR